MTAFDEIRHEYERQVAMGRGKDETPTPRQLLTARLITPWAWQEHAEEHIRWGRTHGLLNSTSHFSGQFMLRRRLALIQADDLLRHLDRQAAGLPELPPLDARALSKKLEGVWWEMQREDAQRHGSQRRYPSKKAVDAIFFMKCADGLPEPKTQFAEDGAVTLTWSEDGRIVRVDIDVQGAMTIAIEPHRESAALDFKGWRTNAPAVLAEATDWVHFGGNRPSLGLAASLMEDA